MLNQAERDFKDRTNAWLELQAKVLAANRRMVGRVRVVSLDEYRKTRLAEQLVSLVLRKRG